VISPGTGAGHQSLSGAEEGISRNHLDGRSPRVLVVDAERVVAEMLSIALNASGIHTITACDGSSAMSAARCFRPDLAIVDLRMPDMDGQLLLSRLLESHPTLLTILLHQKSADRSRPVLDPDPGGWLVKPFSIEDAMSRVRKLMRDNGMDHESLCPVVSVGDLVVDEEHLCVWRGDDQIVLTPTEFALLRFFARNPCRVLGIREILGRVWRYDYTGQSSQVRLYVSYLRRRIDDGRDPMIHTLRRTGYILKPSRGSATPTDDPAVRGARPTVIPSTAQATR